nr:tetratricopeptide repeat-containing sensor histidine kinase [uncultured Flavobacterium sp.]
MEIVNAIDSTQKESVLDSLDIVLSKKRNDSLIRQCYLKIADKYYSINKLQKSLHTSRKVCKMGMEKNDSIVIAKSLYYMGDCYESTKKDSAFYYYLQAEKIYKRINDVENWGRMHFFKAYILFYEGSYTESEIELTKALVLLRGTKNYKLTYSSYNLLANALEGQNNYSEALKYHQLALGEVSKLREDKNDEDETQNYELNTLNNLGHLYIKTEKYEDAIPLLQEVIATKDIKTKWLYLYSTALNNLAYAKMKTGDYRNLPEMFYTSLQIREKLNSKAGIVSSKIRLGEFYLLRKDTAKAISLFNEGYTMSYEIKSHHDILYSLNLLAKIDTENSRFYSAKYIKISDSIAKLERAIQNKYARISYETEKLETEKKNLVKRNITIAITFVLFILFLVVLLIISSLRAKNKEMLHAQQQQEANEEIYKLLMEQQEKILKAREEEKDRIAMELHDGIMNRIYGVRMNLGFFNSKCDEQSIEKRKDYIVELQNIEKEIRVISHDLKGDSFIRDREYADMCQFLLHNQEGVTNTVFDCHIDKDIPWESVSSTLKITIYRIIQEAILNVNKYADAEKCVVSISLFDDQIKLIIDDNGKGFDIQEARKGIGLKNIEQRVASEKGVLKIETAPGKGTRYEILFNYKEATSPKTLL